MNEAILLMPAFALPGLAVGSFLNLCIDRLPLGQSIVRPPSHCPACNHKLGLLDLVPLLSYLGLRGKCRYCKAPIPLRLPIVELITGLLFAFLCWKFGLSLRLGISLVYASLLIIIFVIDLENQLVLNKVVYPGMVLAFAFSFFSPELGVAGAARALLGGVIGAAIMALPLIFYRQGMGMGDIKLAALVGLMTGYPLAFGALILSVIAGGLVAILLLAFRLKKRKESIPFAPFLTTSAMVIWLWGGTIWRWYLP